MADIFDQVSQSPILTSHEKAFSRKRRTSAEKSPTNDDFETPPSTPPETKSIASGIDAPGSGMPDFLYCKKPELVPVTNRKRSFSETMKPPLPYKVSRETRSHRAGYNVDHLAPTTKPVNQGLPDLSEPMSPSKAQSHFVDSLNTNRSFENLASVSSSVTTASPARTSPNTSFCGSSLATSFSSTTDDTDATIQASFAKPAISLHSGNSLLADAGAWDRIGEAQISVGMTTYDHMDVDSESAATYTTAVETNVEPEKLHEVEPRVTSDSDLESHLAERLLSTSPFGKSYLLMVG